ncbi:MAG: TlyA family RNA methyltransferase [Oscillospiraceae bacterium]|nr:TlyA family RNA methyltransferase [Oscillospiraceae bacterium]
MSSKNTDTLSGLEYVSRGGQKLEKALDFFGVSPEGKICIDCGASTGGFTDCLLQRGAKLIYAVDVGYGQLAWNLRKDERVITMERTNIRYVTPDMLEHKPELAVIDVSFISLALVLPVVNRLMTENSSVICLIKPQFEAGRGKVGKKGVVREPGIHKEVLDKFIENSENSNFTVQNITYSPVKGPKGNIEYLGLLDTKTTNDTGDANTSKPIDTGRIVSESHEELK